MTTYTRADPFLAFSGKVGDIDDELGLARVTDSSRNARIVWSATGGPDGDGGWNFLGGNAGGDCCRLTAETPYSLATAEAWAQMRFRLNVAVSAGKHIIMVAVTTGDGANQASLKASIKIDNTRQLYLGDSNGTTNDTALGSPLTVGVVYTILLHAVGGAGGSLTQEAFLYDSTGAQVATCTKAWAVGNVGSNDVAKWGQSGATNTSGLDFDFSHMVVWRGLSTNPGPCKVYALRATSVVGAGNFAATGAADIPTAISENASAARALTDLTSTSASTAISTATGALTAADVGARIANHAGITNVARLIASQAGDGINATLDSSSGVSTSVATAAIIQRRGHDEDVSYAGVNNATASTLELGLADASVPSADEIHAVIVVATMRHTGSGPTIQLGVKSGGSSDLLSIFPTTTTSYNRRRGATSAAATAPSHSLDPATAARWTTSAIDAMTALVRDNDALAREFRVTNLHVLVVAAQVPPATVTAVLDAPLGALVAAIAATTEHPATLAAPLGGLTAGITAAVEHAATMDAPLGGLTAAVSADVDHPAVLAAPLGALDAAMAATVTSGSGQVDAVLDAPLGALVAGVSADVTVAAVLDAPLGGLTAVLAASVAHLATMDAPLGPLVAQVAAVVTQVAVFSAVLGPLTAGMAATPIAGSATLWWGSVPVVDVAVGATPAVAVAVGANQVWP